MKFTLPQISRKKKPAPEPTRTPRASSQPAASTYRRNRTMTDRSTVPEVSERARIHYLRAVRRRIGMILGVVLLGVIVAGVGVSQLSGSVQIVNSQTERVQPIEEAQYQELFAQYYRKHPLERFRFLTNYERMISAFQQTAPEIQSIEPAGIGGIGVSRYEVLVRLPVASWAVDEQRFYVDASGVTFTKNYYEEPVVSVKDNSGASITEGSAIASSRLLSFVGRVVALAQTQGVRVQSIEIPSRSMRQLHLEGKGMPTVRVTIDRGVEVQVQDMAAALKYLKQTDQSPRYVDVRVQGKAFYR